MYGVKGFISQAIGLDLFCEGLTSQAFGLDVLCEGLTFQAISLDVWNVWLVVCGD